MSKHTLPHCTVPNCPEARAGYAAEGYCASCDAPRCSEHSSYWNDAGERFCRHNGYRYWAGPTACELYAAGKLECACVRGFESDCGECRKCSICGGRGYIEAKPLSAAEHTAKVCDLALGALAKAAR